MTEQLPTMQEVLEQSIASRENEVMMYQVNIINYEAAIMDIDTNHSGDSDMVEFRNRLQNDLVATRREQKKAQLMLDAARLQLSTLAL